eukprot:COSAG01_NODE_5143_length_4456_cov_3.943798_2_plen_215_part_00
MLAVLRCQSKRARKKGKRDATRDMSRSFEMRESILGTNPVALLPSHDGIEQQWQELQTAVSPSLLDPDCGAADASSGDEGSNGSSTGSWGRRGIGSGGGGGGGGSSDGSGSGSGRGPRSRSGLETMPGLRLSASQRQRSAAPSAPESTDAAGRLLKASKRGARGPMFRDKDFKDLRLGKALGTGSYGVVHAARWKGREVAVKLVRLNSLGDDET